MKINNVLIRPIVTEKTTQLVSTNVYAFEVGIDTNKDQIAQSLEHLYKVKVGSVRIITRKGKSRRVGRRMVTKQLADKKIAYVKVTEGTIDLFPKA